MNKQLALTGIIIVFFFLSQTPVFGEAEGASFFFMQADEFFNRVVTTDGFIDYVSIKENRAELDVLLSEIARMDLSQLSTADLKFAFWINVYNIFVVDSIVKNYPVESPQRITDFFTRKSHLLSGEKVSLDELEKEIIKTEINDPRSHFVLVCAAVGCPRLLKGAYLPDRLEQQLDGQTRKVLNDSFFVRVDEDKKTIYLSQLFSWYKKDFLQKSDDTVSYINQYRDEPLPEDYSISFVTYDWALNDGSTGSFQQVSPSKSSLQEFTPSTLLSKGQFEFKLFNNVYTQTKFFDDQGEKQDQGNRSTYYAGIGNILYGINSRINVGLDFYIKSVRIDDTSSSAFDVFQFESNSAAHTALSTIAPKIKVTPFSSVQNFAVQTALSIPVSSDLEGNENDRPFLDYDDIQWWTQLFYDYSFGQYALIYGELDFFLRFDQAQLDTEEDDIVLSTPVKIIVNVYPSSKFTIYAPFEYGPTWENSDVSSYYSQVGIGLKYQVTSHIELETLYTIFPAGKSGGAGETYNLGIRFIN